ncbi:MAG: hypothetical protein ACI399_03645 [Candidatus Cryptobacteroides sp.]
MQFRKYGTCFFERYAMLSLQTFLGHEFDSLVNKDRPDLQTEDSRSIGIEVTRAMEEGRSGARRLLKNLAGISEERPEQRQELESIVRSGYGYGIQEGVYVGGLELDYWQGARPLRDIIASKVRKVSSGFYGDFERFDLFVFCEDSLSEPQVYDTVRYVMEIQNEYARRYSRLYLSYRTDFFACTLDGELRTEHRVTHIPVGKEECRRLYFASLDY